MFDKMKKKASFIKTKSSQLYLVIKSGKAPWLVKIIGFLTIAYALSPVDLIPDFIPVLGYLDDLIILPLLIGICVKLIPNELWDSYEEEAVLLWQQGKPTKWYYAVPIIMIWVLFIVLIGLYIEYRL